MNTGCENDTFRLSFHKSFKWMSQFTGIIFFPFDLFWFPSGLCKYLWWNNMLTTLTFFQNLHFFLTVTILYLPTLLILTRRFLAESQFSRFYLNLRQIWTLFLLLPITGFGFVISRFIWKFCPRVSCFAFHFLPLFDFPPFFFVLLINWHQHVCLIRALPVVFVSLSLLYFTTSPVFPVLLSFALLVVAVFFLLLLELSYLPLPALVVFLFVCFFFPLVLIFFSWDLSFVSKVNLLSFTLPTSGVSCVWVLAILATCHNYNFFGGGKREKGIKRPKQRERQKVMKWRN